ncbi:hypothetical protein GYA37_00895 [candidate division WWE3 bacterium]|uniref:Uncharacterized protein n=1 Tax=candidate division WWE3 bacterium TaxID=2053526 RepID=A0A7X9HSN3_UNCKA|nr:hypothetical protein [candidate division WWE3 bacterium]
MDLPIDSLQDKELSSEVNNKSSSKKTLIILFTFLSLVLVLFGILYGVNTGVFNSILKIKTDENKEDLSVIKNTVDGKDTAFGSLVNKSEVLTQEISANDFLTFKEKMLSGISDELWNWKDDFAHVNVYEMNKGEGIIYVGFLIPGDSRFSGSDNIKEHSAVKVSCLDEFTLVVDPSSLEVTKTGVNLFDNLIPGKDSLLFKCSDEKCRETRKECLILKDANTNTNTE